MRAAGYAAWGLASIALFGCASTPSFVSPPSSPPPVFVLASELPEEWTRPTPKAKVAEQSSKLPAIQADSARGASLEAARCPAEMALVEDRVCVDRWEGSLVQRVNGAESAWSPFLAIDQAVREGVHVRAVSKPSVIPQGYISGAQAAAACRASGKRLCASDEWIAACRGPANTTFPYGNERRAGACNDDIRYFHPVAEVGRMISAKSDDWWQDMMNHPFINQLEAGLLPTGERTFCTNGYGVYDMVGNLHEWVDDPDGTFRGGFYMDTSKNGDGCTYDTQAHDFTYHDYSTGFRCCLTPDKVE